MKISLTLISITFCCHLFAQQENPFRAIGKEDKVLSLSKGKYQEFHNNDTLQKIGSVLINSKTGAICGFFDADTLYNESNLNPTIISRWYSLDPLASKYPAISPYAFVGNMPTIAIDPDGKDIIFTVTQREDGKLMVHMTLNAKLVDKTAAGISAEKMGEYRDRIASAVTEYYTYNGTGSLSNVMDNTGKLVSGQFEMSVTVNLEVSDKLAPNDHGIYISDPGHLPDEEMENCVAPYDVLGLSEPGSNYVYVSTKVLENKPEPVPPGGSVAAPVSGGSDRESYAGTGLTSTGATSLERNIGHELGHNFLGALNAALGHANIWNNNLLTPSSQKHHAGTKLNVQQLEGMIDQYQKGNLNSGVQEGPAPAKR